MAEEQQIRVVISGVASDLRRALDGAKGDLGGLSAAIKAVPSQVKVDVQAQTAVATARLRALRDMAKDVPNRINIEASADTGVAEAKLRLLERQARQTEEAIARAQLGSLISGGGGGGGFFSGMSGLPLGGGPGVLGLGTAATAAVAPFAVAGAGSLTAIAGSAGAGLLGLGALVTSALGTLSVGLGSMLAVFKGASGDISTMQTAIEHLATAQLDYGAKSKQAAQAQTNLNGLISLSSPLTYTVAKSLYDLANAWQDAEQPALQALYKIMIPGIQVLKSLMPTVAGIAQEAFGAIGKALEPVFKGLSSPAFKKVLTDLGDAFAKLAGPAIGAFSNLMRAFFSVSVAAAPYVLEIAQAFERWTKSFADSLTPGAHMNALIGDLVGQLRTWWNLAVALGHIMVTVFKTGADTGQQLVGQLTAILVKWNAWLNTSAGQAALHKFFSDSANLLRAVATTLGAIAPLIFSMATGLIPTMTTLLAPLAKILAAISQWINGISKDLPPVLSALPGLAVAVGVLASWQALRALVTSTFGAMTGGTRGAAVAAAAPEVIGAGEKGGLGLGTRILGGLGLATFGTLLATEIGNAIKGGAGRAIKDIGTGASIGVGLGSLFGPWGAAIGAALGGGIGAAVDLMVKHGPSDGDKWAKGFTSSLPGHVSNAVAKGLKDAVNAPPPKPGSQQANIQSGANPYQAILNPEHPAAGLTSAQFAQQFNAEFNFAYTAGRRTGDAWVAGMQSVKFPTEFLALRDMQERLAHPPPTITGAGVAFWRDEAAKQMLAYATSLEQNGKLPRGSVDRMIATLEQRFPGLIAYLDRAGQASAAAIASHLKLDQALSNLSGALADMRSQWGDTALATKITSENINKNTAQAMSDLRLLMHSKNRQIRDDAKAEYDKLQADNKAMFDAMVAQSAAGMAKAGALIQAGGAAAAASAQTSFGAVRDAIVSSIGAGTQTMAAGAAEMTKELNAVLSAFGAAKISSVGFTPSQALAATVSYANYFFHGSTGPGVPGAHAGGGLIQVGRPGQRGPDRIPMNVGGVPIRVGAGEQVGVFNAQQQALAGRLIPGGLDGLFAATRGTRHDMASGGIVTASQFGGPGDPGTGSVGYRGDNLYAHPDSYAELNMGTALGGLPYLAALNVTKGSKTIRVLKRDIGAGGPGLGGHVRAIDLWFQAANALGLGGLANVMVGGSGGVNVSIAGGGGAGGGGVSGQITAPGVRGTGAIAGIVRAAFGKIAAGANALVGRAMPGVNITPGPASGTGGTTVFEGVTMAKWIADELAWATQHGWHGQPTSGYRPGFDPHATGGSEHALTRYPGGAVDFGGYNDPAAYATKLALVELAARLGYPGPRLMMPIGFHDDGHLSGTGHAQGGLIPGFAGGGQVARSARAAKRPPAPAKHHHTKSKSKYQPFIPKDALKGLLSTAELRPDRMAAAYARQVTVADQTFQNLLAAQALTPVDDPELVTLSDADVTALDPNGSLGYQAGDQLVNRNGMTVGRFFGPGGTIQGGTFHPGASTRLAQIAAILANRNPRYGALRSEMGAQGAAIGMDSRATGQRVGRRARIERYLHKSVQRAGVIKAELDVLKSKNLAQALRQALSKQAIGKRLGGLRSHLRTVTDELAAERHSQSLLIPIQQDPTHTNALQAEAQNLRDSIAIESQLGSSGTGAVQRAKSAIYAHGLQSQLAALQKTNVQLGGKSLSAGTGGAIGQITGQITTLTADSVARRNTLADFKQTELIPAAAEIASYVKERADIGTLANIQVRDPNATTAAAGPDLAALNALLQTQLAQTQQALSLSQAQFAVFQGFAPLLTGRLVGSFQSGIDFVPRTGLALVHRGETITPDPAGPQGNRAAATVHTAQGPISIELHFANNEAPLMKLMDARMNGKALRIVSEKAGQRARLMAGVRRS